MSVSSFRICLLLDESKEVYMSSREALSMPFTRNRVCLFAELREKYTTRQKEKVINETLTDIKYQFEV